MKRHNAREFETPFGMFYGGIYDTENVHGVEFYAETESGEVTVNGVTYSGTVYARRYSHSGDLFLSVQHLTKWDGRHFQSASESAQAKLATALLPQFAELEKDTDYIRAHRVQVLKRSLEYADRDLDREIGKRNAISRELLELGERESPPIPTVEMFMAERSYAAGLERQLRAAGIRPFAANTLPDGE